MSFIQSSTVHKEEDNLSIVDKMAGPQCVLYSESSTVHKEEDNLTIYSGQNGWSPMCNLFHVFYCKEIIILVSFILIIIAESSLNLQDGFLSTAAKKRQGLSWKT